MPTDVHEFLPMFILKTKCFYSNIEKAFDLLKEVAFESKLDNKKRLKEIIGQIYTNLKITLTETQECGKPCNVLFLRVCSIP